MPSALDRRVAAVIDDLTKAGGPLPLTDFTGSNGIIMPMIASAPPTLVAYFDHFCAEHRDRTFLVAGDERLSFGEVHGAAREVAAALIGRHGVNKGDRICIAMPNAPSWVVIYMAILMAGGIATLLNGWWQGEELCEAIGEAGASLVLADPERARRLDECGRETAPILTIDTDRPLRQALAMLLGEPMAALPALSGDDFATILFTSGSTGRAKGALSTHRAVVQAIFNYLVTALMMLRIGLEDGRIGPDTPPHAILMTVPLFHVTGEVPMLLLSLAIGRKIVLMHKWDALTAMRLIEAEKVTNFTGVPLMSWEILNHPDFYKYDLSTVQSFAAGGAPRPAGHVLRLGAEMPAPPSIGYGLTETNAVGCGNFSSNYIDKPNSTGPASRPLVDLAIIDESGAVVPAGTQGEITIRSVANFSGYWQRHEATSEAITADGRVRTGDIGYLDDDGYLFIVGRKKDIIIRGGENISAQEVETAIYAYPGIAEVAVFALPDERMGEVPGAVIHPRSGDSVDIAALLDFLAHHLAAFKIPGRIWIADEPLPKLGTQKIDKIRLGEEYRARHDRETATSS